MDSTATHLRIAAAVVPAASRYRDTTSLRATPRQLAALPHCPYPAHAKGIGADESQTDPSGFNLNTQTDGGYLEYEFVGTGFDFRLNPESGHELFIHTIVIYTLAC